MKLLFKNMKTYFRFLVNSVVYLLLYTLSSSSSYAESVWVVPHRGTGDNVSICATSRVSSSGWGEAATCDKRLRNSTILATQAFVNSKANSTTAAFKNEDKLIRRQMYNNMGQIISLEKEFTTDIEDALQRIDNIPQRILAESVMKEIKKSLLNEVDQKIAAMEERIMQRINNRQNE